MVLKYDFNINNNAIIAELKRLTNQTYKLLPNREEGVDWEKPLATILEELSGIDSLFQQEHVILFRLIAKLEGLFTLTETEDFQLFRSTIFECLGLLSELIKLCQD